MGASRVILVQLQPLRRGGVQDGPARSAEVQGGLGALPVLLQPVHEPQPVDEAGEQTLRHGQSKMRKRFFNLTF